MGLAPPRITIACGSKGAREFFTVDYWGELEGHHRTPFLQSWAKSGHLCPIMDVSNKRPASVRNPLVRRVGMSDKLLGNGKRRYFPITAEKRR